MSQPTCVIVGVGPGNGAAFARKFSAGGYQVALLARSAEYGNELASTLPTSKAYAVDVTDLQALGNTLSAIEREMSAIDVVVYNAGSASWGNVSDVDIEDFAKAWEINARGLLAMSKQVTPGMIDRGAGAIIVVGATASLKASEMFPAFASAKSAQRALAQSMSKHLAPKGVHVALMIIDGMIDTPTVRSFAPDIADDALIDPEQIADAAWYLCQQAPSAWTFEMDLRTQHEKW